MYVYYIIYEVLNMKNLIIKRKDFLKEYFKFEDLFFKVEKRIVVEFRVIVYYNVI